MLHHKLRQPSKNKQTNLKKKKEREFAVFAVDRRKLLKHEAQTEKALRSEWTEAKTGTQWRRGGWGEGDRGGADGFIISGGVFDVYSRHQRQRKTSRTETMSPHNGSMEKKNKKSRKQERFPCNRACCGFWWQRRKQPPPHYLQPGSSKANYSKANVDHV